MKLPDPVRFLAEICRRQGWTFTLLDPHSGYLCAVSDGRRQFLSGAGKVVAYPLNHATAVSVASDKTHAATLAARAGLRVPVGEHFFTTERFKAMRGAGRELNDAVVYAQSLGFPVFVKPNDGSCGAFADIAYTPDDIARLFAAMAETHAVALIQGILTGREYRIFAVDGVPQMAYERRTGGLVGDGSTTIADLLATYDQELVVHGMTPITLVSPYFRHQLAVNRLIPATILPKDVVLAVSPRRNISAGAEIGDFRTTFSPALAAYVSKATGAVGLRVCGLDVIAPHGLDDPDSFTLLEMNGNPSLSGAAKAGYEENVLAVWTRIAEIWFTEAEK